MQPRQPTPEERAALLHYVMHLYDKHPDEEQRVSVQGLIEQAAIAVFDNYITDGPGYAGKVMVVVWSGAPEIHEVFIWAPIDAGDPDGKLIRRVSCCG